MQTCRRCALWSVIPDPRDSGVVYIYVSGNYVSRHDPRENWLGARGARTPDEDPHTSLFSINAIRVPLASLPRAPAS